MSFGCLRSQTRSTVLVTLGGLFLTGCAHTRYSYTPLPDPSFTENKAVRGAIFPITQGASQGQIRIYSPGIVTVKGDSKLKNQPAILIRIAVSNFGKSKWDIDVREQHLSDGGEGDEGPVSVNTAHGTPPFTEILPHETQILDLYYATGDHKASEDLDNFNFQWLVHTPEGPVGKKLNLVRNRREEESVPQVASTSMFFDPIYPWGPIWWDEPGLFPGMPFFPISPFYFEEPYFYQGTPMYPHAPFYPGMPYYP